MTENQPTHEPPDAPRADAVPGEKAIVNVEQHVGPGGESKRPHVWRRVLAAACYLGAAPLLPRRLRRADAFLSHHHAQGLAVISLLLVALLFAATVFLPVATWVIVHHPEFTKWLEATVNEHCPWVKGIDLYLLAGLLACWGLLIVAGVVLAVRGSVRSLPLVCRLARRRWWVRAAAAGNGLVLLLVAVAAGLTVHAVSLTRADDAPAKVYLLYDYGGDGEPCGRWGPALMFYRVSLAAQARWGPGNVVVARLSEEKLRQALQHGRFLMVWSHGTAGGILNRKTFIWPPSLQWQGGPCLFLRSLRFDGEKYHPAPSARQLPIGTNLRYVYLSACNGGESAAEWERALAPAIVITFGRNTGGLEHVWWLWIHAADQLSRID